MNIFQLGFWHKKECYIRLNDCIYVNRKAKKKKRFDNLTNKKRMIRRNEMKSLKKKLIKWTSIVTIKSHKHTH